MKVWRRDGGQIDRLPGVHWKVLAHDDNLLLLLVRIEPGHEVPMHNHVNIQAGYVIKGRARITLEGGSIELSEGDSYIIPSMERHSAAAIGDSELITLEFFLPAHKEFSQLARDADVTL